MAEVMEGEEARGVGREGVWLQSDLGFEPATLISSLVRSTE